MSQRPRGQCPACFANCAVTKSGRIWAHQRFLALPKGTRTELCTGTGQQPRKGITA